MYETRNLEKLLVGYSAVDVTRFKNILCAGKACTSASRMELPKATEEVK